MPKPNEKLPDSSCRNQEAAKCAPTEGGITTCCDQHINPVVHEVMNQIENNKRLSIHPMYVPAHGAAKGEENQKPGNCNSGCGIDGEVREDAACACSGDETRGVCPCHGTATGGDAAKTCCDKPMVENGNGTGIRCAKKCGYWEARPPYIKVEIVSGQGIQHGHRAVLFDDTRITPKKVSPCTVEESWAVDANDLLENPAIRSLLSRSEKVGEARAWGKAVAAIPEMEFVKDLCTKHAAFQEGCEWCRARSEDICQTSTHNNARKQLIQAAKDDGHQVK